MPRSTLPRSTVLEISERNSASFSRYNEGTRRFRSSCLLLRERTSTVIFLPGSSSTALPKPVIERIIIQMFKDKSRKYRKNSCDVEIFPPKNHWAQGYIF